MAKTILQGTVKGARIKERKTEEETREDDIKKRTWMEFGDSLRAAEDRERYCCKVIRGAPTTVKGKGLRWEDICMGKGDNPKS